MSIGKSLISLMRWRSGSFFMDFSTPKMLNSAIFTSRNLGQIAIAPGLRAVYTSENRAAADTAFGAFKVNWGDKYPNLIESWERDWEELMAFMDFPEQMRKMIYTTNPVEALHRIIRKLIKGKAAWVSDTALMKQIYLSLMHNEKSWKKNARGWKAIMRDLIDLYGDRITRHLLGA